MHKLEPEVPVTGDQGKCLEELQEKYYSILKEQGFVDIENSAIPNRPLKEWHNKKFCSDKIQIKMEIRSQYQLLVDEFTNRKDFTEICKKVVWHKSCYFSVEQIKNIWDLSNQHGWSERKIAKELKTCKSAIHRALERLRQWMNLL